MSHTLPFDDATNNLIRKSARAICRSPGFFAHEYPDHVQDLAQHVAANLDHYEPSRGPRSVFILCLVDRRRISIIRHRHSQKREPAREAFSLDEVTGRGEAAQPRHESIREASVNPWPAHELAKDMLSILDLLPDGGYQVVIRSLDQTPLEIAKQLGLTAEQVEAHLRVFKTVCEEQGLGGA